MKKIYSFEPWFFIFFGVFHLHRIWALFDRVSYASFWINIMEEKGLFYFLLMGILCIFCILGIVVFFRIWGRILCGVGFICSGEAIYFLICLQLLRGFLFGVI